MKTFSPFVILFLLFSACSSTPEKKEITETKVRKEITKKMYSKAVNDTFTVFISLPEGYDANKQIKYPVVYFSDANLYFEIYSSLQKKYSEVGLLAPCILIGIGYKDFNTMDSLRNRDLTFPAAIPEYEMSVSGGADKFLSFITSDLVSAIDSSYRTDENRRILTGHSLGGYFALFALQQSLKSKNTIFSAYIAASPSTDYNHNCILDEFKKLATDNGNKTKVFVTFGGLEDLEEDEEDKTALKTNEIFLSLDKSLKEKNKINYKGELYSNLDHMDTPLPTFVKGLQWILADSL
ncbi:MAG: alpha/beta hydrolase [Bacteroidia bacterium]|nr:alpha/beta hydrolase [Bacteroidia bacterium]